MKLPNYTPILYIGVINGRFSYKINSMSHLPLLVFNDPKCCKWPIIIHDIKDSNLVKTLALGSQPLAKMHESVLGIKDIPIIVKK
jgi:hypothetical protein